ncbi:MAG TPA: trypsin-like peptidase domain-containing protein, partial [Cyclobacteriaceae bacterium]|nr:trypsin-like peptidase domain-containing protein [Cyclobacteriaceae bacterium]
MNENIAIVELLDGYVKGTLSPEGILAVEKRMQEDAAFRQQVEENVALVKTLELAGQRTRLRNTLEQVHGTLARQVVSLPARGWKKYRTLSGVAASVALISIAATLWITHNIRSEQNYEFLKLRRSVDQIQKNQNALEKNLKKRTVVPTPQYAATGFLVSSEGYVITSHHVINKADSVYIQNEKYGNLKAVVVHSDPLNDVSVLKIVTPVKIQSVPYTIAEAEADLA